jgi:NAD(P)-dependent dehydrogenase (short-subunit alcohol dehydrogenase family)
MTIPTDFTLQGAVALVTGASSGLGARFAQVLAGAGARVVAAARRVERLEALCADIAAAGGQARAVAMDVEDEASVVAGFDAAGEAFGAAPTIVIANAGMNARGLAVDIPMADFDQLMAVNLRGVFVTAREGARRMMAAGSADSGAGRVVLVASMGGVRPLPGLVPYSVSKAGVIMMARALALEWAKKGINVNALCPGYVETEINADWLQEPGGVKMVQGFPRRRVMDGSSLDGALLWLAGPQSRFVTGSVVQVDDGQGI